MGGLYVTYPRHLVPLAEKLNLKLERERENDGWAYRVNGLRFKGPNATYNAMRLIERERERIVEAVQGER